MGCVPYRVGQSYCSFPSIKANISGCDQTTARVLIILKNVFEKIENAWKRGQGWMLQNFFGRNLAVEKTIEIKKVCSDGRKKRFSKQIIMS